MKKVGIITFHYLDNYGAVLQTYALQEAINKIPGYAAEIINYIPEGACYYPYEEGPEGKHKLEEKRELFENFLKNHCGLSSTRLDHVTGNEYDYYCVGSDQVWNFAISNEDTTYLLQQLDENAVRISYGSSIGMSAEELEPYTDVYRDCLSLFKHVAVRENVHVDWLRESCHIDSCAVLDPTFLLNEKDYLKIVSKKKHRDHPFIFFLWYAHDDQFLKAVEFVNTVSRKYGLPIVHNIINVRPYIFANDDGCMMYEGIEDFLWYLKNAKIVVTNSFHASIFSIHFKKPFYSFIVDSMRSRFDTLCAQTKIEDRMVDHYIPSEDITMDMDYDKIYEELEPYREFSKHYLKDALDVTGEENE